MRLSEKQVEYVNNATHRYNFKIGATRSGKTFLDYELIPRRIRSRAGKAGLNVILGYTKTSIQRNIIRPMQEIYGIQMVSDIRSDNTAFIFGEVVYCLGASKANSVDSIRGSSIKYCYGDEVTTWHTECFEMVKSRLDKAYSMFEGTCNPKEPTHWLYEFMTTSKADVYYQEYTIFDNPFLDINVLRDIINSHTGVFKQRYVYGKWCVAEGIIFRDFADNKDNYLITEPDKYTKLVMGVDFGGTGSKTTFVLVGYRNGFKGLDVLEEYGLPVTENIDSDKIGKAFIEFGKHCQNIYKQKLWVFPDNASPTMINTLRTYAKNNGLHNSTITGCTKTEIADRPRFIDVMLNTNRLRVKANCTNVINALSHLRWDSKNSSVPEDLNINNMNDWYDAFCYSWTKYQRYIELERG